MATIRSLLDALNDFDRDAVDRLCDIRGVGGRSRSAKCEALARSYRGDHEQLFDDLRKPDLALLLEDPTDFDEGSFYLSAPNRFSKAELVEIAHTAFRDEDVPVEFEPFDDEDYGDEEEFEDEDFEDEFDDDDFDDGVDHWSDEYRAEFWKELAFGADVAAQPLRPYQECAVQTVLAALDPSVPQILRLATGGGKTRVANAIVERWRGRVSGSVLWVTKDWRLLKQAASDVSRRVRGVRLSRLGGDGQVIHPLDDSPHGDLVYTTIQTMTRRLSQGALSRVSPTLLVWDECHWGEHGGAGRVLTACKRASIPVLGLTATPRAASRYKTRTHGPSVSWLTTASLHARASKMPFERASPGPLD